MTKEAAEQRHLADKAEASRFTELREYLKAELQKTAERDAVLNDKLAQKMDMVRNFAGRNHRKHRQRPECQPGPN